MRVSFPRFVYKILIIYGSFTRNGVTINLQYKAPFLRKMDLKSSLHARMLWQQILVVVRLGGIFQPMLVRTIF